MMTSPTAARVYRLLVSLVLAPRATRALLATCRARARCRAPLPTNQPPVTFLVRVPFLALQEPQVLQVLVLLAPFRQLRLLPWVLPRPRSLARRRPVLLILLMCLPQALPAWPAWPVLQALLALLSGAVPRMARTIFRRLLRRQRLAIATPL